MEDELQEELQDVVLVQRQEVNGKGDLPVRKVHGHSKAQRHVQLLESGSTVIPVMETSSKRNCALFLHGAWKHDDLSSVTGMKEQHLSGHARR